MIWVVYCFLQAVLGGRFSSYAVAVGVMIFAFTVELLQKINIVDILGLGGIPFFRTLIGTTFSPVDLICYAAGSAIICAAIFIKKNIKDKT